MLFPACSAIRLTTREGLPYWFRTCDIGGDIWAEGTHPVSFPKGSRLPLTGRAAPLRFAHKTLGITYGANDAWLLDGVNDAGLTGGLLALSEGTSVSTAAPGWEGVMGMELLTWLLGRCGSVPEVVRSMGDIQLLDVPAGEGKGVPATMHCMLTDPTGACVILEAADPAHPGRLTAYEKNLGLMTNSPPYPRQLQNLSWFLSQSPELNWDQKAPVSLTLNGMTVAADPAAPHLSLTGTFPASYAPCDRFVRLAVLAALNREGRDMPARRVLPLGAALMEAVAEPRNRGVFHYLKFDPTEGPAGGHESYTQYLVMYDLTARTLYLRPYDTTAWTALSLGNCPDGEVRRHPVCREPLGGVVKGN